ncbi:MAG: helix-turn-helix transcriptional regulator [Bacteroidales bacterium]|nr:helix-turn-helix transcriptional regulator [Bacteroidales bacterium]
MLREAIKKQRIYSALTQKQMAQLLGMSVTKYLRKENGRLKIELAEVKKLAKVLQLDERILITYWMADDIQELMLIDKSLTEDAIRLVNDNFLYLKSNNL